MFRSFIATALAASLALTAFAAPARADAEDVAKVILGLAIVAGIASAIDNNNDPAPAARHNTYRDQDWSRQWNHRGGRRRAIPARCLRPFETRRGTRYGFSERCLDRRAEWINPPERCRRRGENRRGHRITFYGERCMARLGFRTARN